MKKDYSKIKELLEAQEEFPLRFTFKFIGHNSAGFAQAVARLEKSFPALRHEKSRENGGGKHVAKTYVIDARDAAAIIEIYQAIELIEDLLVVL